MDRRAWFGRVARDGVGAGGALALIGVSGAAEPVDEGFDGTLARLGAGDAAPDPRLVVDIATDAWSGAFVMVRIDASALVGVRALHLLRDDHVPAPIARLETADALPARLTLPIRLDRPCRLRALARTDLGWRRADGVVRAVGFPGCG